MKATAGDRGHLEDPLGRAGRRAVASVFPAEPEQQREGRNRACFVSKCALERFPIRTGEKRADKVGEVVQNKVGHKSSPEIMQLSRGQSPAIKDAPSGSYPEGTSAFPIK